jgi:hypothetical protein
MSSTARPGASFSGGLTLPLLTSVVLHALMALLFWTCGTRRGRDFSWVVDTAVGGNERSITLSLVSMPAAPPSPSPSVAARGSTKSSDEQEFNVVVLPTPTVVEGPSVEPPRFLPPEHARGSGSRQPSGNEGTNGDGPGDEGTGSGLSGCLRAAGPVRSVVYVIDCSMSMGGPDGRSDKFSLARRELLDSLRRLQPGTLFQVIPYNHQAAPLRIDGQTGLVPLSDRSERATAEALENRRPAGGTDHGQALRRGLLLRPEVLFFVTDGDDLQPAQERDATTLNKGRTVIHVVELSFRPSPPSSPLRALARNNRGTFRNLHVPR